MSILKNLFILWSLSLVLSSCNTSILENSAISQELITTIVRKAALMEKADKEKK